MIAKIIEFSVRNRWLVIIAWLGIAVWGVYAVLHTPVDAIPDLSENQVIVFADWMGRSPQDVEEQVTYPLSVQLQGLAGVKTIRSSSEPNFSMINIIFDEKVDPYFARTRVMERLSTARASLPGDVAPILAPDATALGQIFWYTVEGEGKSTDELRAIQDFNVRYQLASIPGVAEVASVGGFVREYQVDIDPLKLRAFDLPLGDVYGAIAASNMSVGGKVVNESGGEYMLRGVGWLRGVDDLEKIVVANRNGVPVVLDQVARVQLGPGFRRGALEKNGEAVGGVVMMRIGQNPLEVTRAIKQKIRDLQAGLPEGVRVVPFYERTRLIESAIHTVTGTLKEEMLIASIAILLILTHLRSAIVVCVTLPMAVLISFLFMYYLEIPSNIMSLCGIAISIGILVDASVVMVENASHELKAHFAGRGDGRVRGDTTEIVIRSCRLVGRPIFFSVLIMLLSFLPVFAFGGQGGKLSHPLAFTKSFAMVGVAFLAITLVPAMIPLLIRGRLRGEEENPIVRSFIRIYRPMLSYVIDRPGAVWFIMSAILVVGASLVGSNAVMSVAVGAGVVLICCGNRLIGAHRTGHFVLKAIAVVALLAIGFFADTRFKKLGSEFMPTLDEGSIMDMPITAPRVAMGQAMDDVTVRDRLLRSFPEVEQAVGKIGRAETPTDPSPVDMVETIVSLRPTDLWPKRKLRFDDALTHAADVAAAMQGRGYLSIPAGVAWAEVERAIRDPKYAESRPDLTAAAQLLNTATQVALEKFDSTLRSLALRRHVEFQPKVTEAIVALAYDDVLRHARTLPPAHGVPAIVKQPSDVEWAAVLNAAQSSGALLAEMPRQEEVDRLLNLVRNELVKQGVLAERTDLLLDTPGMLGRAMKSVGGAIGISPVSFAERTFRYIEDERERLARERLKTLDWELFDFGAVLINDELIDALRKTSMGTPLAGAEPKDVDAFRGPLVETFRKRAFLWRKTKDDLVKEMDSELQMPGWGNVWTQPIINRVNMLATGVRTQIGVKVFGPSGKSLNESVADVQRVSEKIAAKLKTVRGAVDVVPEQATGKRYVEVTIDREAAARYGVAMEDLSQAIEIAMGGKQVTTTVEGRQRFPVRLRYAQDYWQDVDAIKNVLVTGRATPVRSALGNEGPQQGGTQSPAGMIQVPLYLVADVRVADGPAMIKSENGRLRSYVTLNVRDRDLLGFVDEARAAVVPIEKELAGTGMSIEWAGEFEAQVRTNQTLAVIFPMVAALIVLLLYVTFHSFVETLLVVLAVLGALAGSVMFQALFGFNFSVIVWIGYIAAFGMATQTGVIMLVYLREAIERRGGLKNIASLADLRQAVIEGAVHRLRPKLLTEGVAIIGLVPMLWATGTGAEIMRPMAAPVIGGLLISDEVVDLMIPVVFYWLKRRQWSKEVDATQGVDGTATRPAHLSEQGSEAHELVLK